MAKIELLSVYKLLPQTNCGECGEVSCMIFASRLIERKYKPEDCKPLVREAKYRKRLEELVELVSPPVREVVIGVGERAVKIGGKEVIYRHELTLHNPTAIAIDVSDTMPEDELIKRVKEVEGFVIERIGERLKLDMVAIRGASGVPEKFADACSLVARNTGLPMILCSLDPTLLNAALRREEVKARRPLLYAATKENWREIAILANRHGCPVVAFEPGELKDLKSLALSLEKAGVKEIVLDPGSYTEGEGFMKLVNKIVMIRRASIARGEKGLNYPILCVPATVWLDGGEEPVTSFKEAYIACVLLGYTVDALVIHTMQPWAHLALLTLRQGIFTDPRKPVSVDPGLRRFGNPGKGSPVLVTTNFALTYYTVAHDIEASKIDCYLLVIDTGGLAVEVSVAGGQFNASKVKEVMNSSKIEREVEHRRLVIPRRAARLKGEIEDETKWEVLVGPEDSSQIKDFISKKWGE